MATPDPGRAGGFAPRDPTQRDPGRLPYVDNLKVLLITAIIAMHAVMSYAGTMDLWTYTEMREVTLSPVVEGALFVVALPFGLFMIGLLFLVAGLLTPQSLDRKGPARFAKDRLLRLGVPFAAYVLLVQPALVYALEHPLGLAPRSYWEEFLGDEGELDTGPLWFVGVLLTFSLVYAAWVALRQRPPQPRERELTAGQLALAVAVVAPASFLVRMAYPYGSESGFTDLNLWQWPACIAVFALGIVGSRDGWLTTVPDRLRRQCRTVTLVAAGAMAGLLILAGLLDEVEAMMGGPNWLAVAFATIECTLNLFGPIWLLGAAQRHLDRPLRWAGPRVSRSAYGAFILQTPVLLALAVALRQIPLPAEAKALLLVGGGVSASFVLAWLLISRVPGISRVL